MNVRKILYKAYNLASALRWIHQQGLVHQDVHANNVLNTLDGSGWVLVDFGSAQWEFQENSSKRTVLDTLWYGPSAVLACSVCFLAMATFETSSEQELAVPSM